MTWFVWVYGKVLFFGFLHWPWCETGWSPSCGWGQLAYCRFHLAFKGELTRAKWRENCWGHWSSHWCECMYLNQWTQHRPLTLSIKSHGVSLVMVLRLTAFNQICVIFPAHLTLLENLTASIWKAFLFFWYTILRGKVMHGWNCNAINFIGDSALYQCTNIMKTVNLWWLRLTSFANEALK